MREGGRERELDKLEVIATPIVQADRLVSLLFLFLFKMLICSLLCFIGGRQQASPPSSKSVYAALAP